ncbi:MAG TPA: hypothetical protein VE959_18470 [Bryobacteraceae bacterium]|nr:hypothetical protein [Bryobacteraceae bacterium]
MRRLFEWQRQPLIPLKGRKEHLNGFTLMFTTQIGPPAMHPDYLHMLRQFLQENIEKQPVLLDLLEGRSGLRDLGRLESERFDLFFKLAVPKVIASILLDEDWFIDPDSGLAIFQFDRDSQDGPYTLLHMVMDVKRQNPSRDNRVSHTHPQAALEAYSAVVRQIFEVAEKVVVQDQLDLDQINRSLETIRARRRTYCPDEPQTAAP